MHSHSLCRSNGPSKAVYMPDGKEIENFHWFNFLRGGRVAPLNMRKENQDVLKNLLPCSFFKRG